MAQALTTPEAIQRCKRTGPVALRRGAQLPQLPPRHGRGVIQNLTVAVTGTTHGAAVISLPRSQVEMTDRDLGWQDRITKVVRRVAIVNEENGEVVHRQLFEDLRADPPRGRRGVWQLVLRTPRPAPAGVDRGELQPHRGQSARVSPAPL